MPEVMSWMYEAHWVKLAPVRLTVVSPAKRCIPGGGGGTAIRELVVGHCSHDHSGQRPLAPSSSGISQSQWEISPHGVLVRPQHDVLQSTISEKSN